MIYVCMCMVAVHYQCYMCAHVASALPYPGTDNRTYQTTHAKLDSDIPTTSKSMSSPVSVRSEVNLKRETFSMERLLGTDHDQDTKYM